MRGTLQDERVAMLLTDGVEQVEYENPGNFWRSRAPLSISCPFKSAVRPYRPLIT